MDIQIETIQYTTVYWEFLLPMIMAAADIATGWIQASINSTWDSTKMRKGLFRKSGEIGVVVLAYATGIAIELPINLAAYVSIYIVIMEAVSVMENLDLAGIPMPTWITHKLKKIAKNMSEGEKDETTESTEGDDQDGEN